MLTISYEALNTVDLGTERCQNIHSLSLSLSLSLSRTSTHRNDLKAKFKPLLGNMSFKEIVSTSWILCSKCGEVKTTYEKEQSVITQFHLIKGWELVESYLHDPVFVINLITGESFVSPKVYEAVTRASSRLHRMLELWQSYAWW